MSNKYETGQTYTNSAGDREYVCLGYVTLVPEGDNPDFEWRDRVAGWEAQCTDCGEVYQFIRDVIYDSQPLGRMRCDKCLVRKLANPVKMAKKEKKLKAEKLPTFDPAEEDLEKFFIALAAGNPRGGWWGRDRRCEHWVGTLMGEMLHIKTWEVKKRLHDWLDERKIRIVKRPNSNRKMIDCVVLYRTPPT